MNTRYHFDPVDIERLRQIARLTPGGRIRLMLNARELAVGLMRGRLRRRYPDLSPVALNLKLLEEIEHAKARSRFEPVF
jgi:hypothetical protein